MTCLASPIEGSVARSSSPAPQILCRHLESPAQNAGLIANASTGCKAYSDAAPKMATDQKRQILQTLVDYIPKVMGEPTYCFTVTFKPVFGHQRRLTKTVSAAAALRWFFHCLNTKCFGKGYKRKKYELGLYATFEGLDINEALHCHGAIRLPKKLSHGKFLNAFGQARRSTCQLGRKFDLKPYRDTGWIKYTLKTGPDSFQPEFLRRGTS